MERAMRGKPFLTTKYLFRSLDGTPVFTVQVPIDWYFFSSPGAYVAFKSFYTNITLTVTHQRNHTIEHTEDILSIAQEYAMNFLSGSIKTYGYCPYLGGHDRKTGKLWLPIDPILGKPYPIALEFEYHGQSTSGFKVVFLQPKEVEWTFTLTGSLTHRNVAELQKILKTLRPVAKNDLSSKSVIKLSPNLSSQFLGELISQKSGCLMPTIILSSLILGGLLSYVF